MSVKSRFRVQFHNKHSKRTQRLLKSAQRYLYHICWSLWTSFSWKKSFLVLCKTSDLFLNTLTYDDKYSLLYRDILMQPIQIPFSQKHKTFCQFFSPFWKSTLNFERFQNEITHIADVFPKLPSPKKMIR